MNIHLGVGFFSLPNSRVFLIILLPRETLNRSCAATHLLPAQLVNIIKQAWGRLFQYQNRKDYILK